MFFTHLVLLLVIENGPTSSTREDMDDADVGEIVLNGSEYLAKAAR
jgi:hypothetical protein